MDKAFEMVLNDSTFRQLRDFIYDKCGIFIPDSKKYLIENRLIRKVQENGLKGFEDYFQMIKQNGNREVISKLFDSITTNETYFFRESHQLDVLIDNIIPDILKTNPKKVIKIWSAGCSTGEEPYTILMMARERIGNVRLDITASDISEAALCSARRAIYTSYSTRNVPEYYLKKYFIKRDNVYELIKEIRDSVKFLDINLIDDRATRSLIGIDVILCRNVLIYFDDKMKQRAVSLLYNSLVPNGYFFIGSSESLHNISRAFLPVIYNRVVVYKKK